MRSRRGGTMGGSSHPLKERSTSSPSSKLHHPQSFGEGRHHNTRRGRGRARSSGVPLNEFVVHFDNSPPPLQPAPHSAHFRFCSSLNRPVITASISISFSEEITHSASQVDITNLSQEGTHRLNNWRDSGKNVMVDSLFTSLGLNLVEFYMVNGVALMPRTPLVVQVMMV